MFGLLHAPCVVLVFLYFFVNTNAKAPKLSDGATNLLNLLNLKTGKEPIIIYLNQQNKNNFRSSDVDEDYAIDYEYYTGRNDYEEDYDSNEYIEDFFNAVQRNVRPDSKSGSSQSFEATKNILRSVLRSRCQKVESCIDRCPPKKPSCPVKCQQKLDDLNLCQPPPDPCKKQQCWGKTMPPKWRF